VQTAAVRVRIRHESDRWRFDNIIANANKTALETTIGELNALHPKNLQSAESTRHPAGRGAPRCASSSRATTGARRCISANRSAPRP